MGQYIQDGLRNIFETVLNIEKPTVDITIKKMVKILTVLISFGKTMDLLTKRLWRNFAGSCGWRSTQSYN